MMNSKDTTTSFIYIKDGECKKKQLKSTEVFLLMTTLIPSQKSSAIPLDLLYCRYVDYCINIMRCQALSKNDLKQVLEERGFKLLNYMGSLIVKCETDKTASEKLLYSFNQPI